MIKAEFDIPKLQRSLKSAAKNFGESSKQAVVRWGIQTAREMAVETQAWGKSKTKGIQEGAIFADALNVFLVIDARNPVAQKRKAQRKKELVTPEDINAWIEINRTRRRGRTAVLPVEEKKEVTSSNLLKALKVRNAKAGMAKGGWLGAGMDIAKAQTGQGRINIGKNFLGYAQKHKARGSSRKPMNPWKPVGILINSSSHSASKHVTRPEAYQKAIGFGLRKTIQWYRKAAKQSLDKA